mgnify:FL=1|jgi:hypothetical protein
MALEGPVDSSKVYKIKYTINTLNQLGEYVKGEGDEREFVNPGVSLLELCAVYSAQEIFETNCLEECITFKWEAFALSFHKVGCFFHFAYLTIMLVYVNAIYITDQS